MTAVLLGSALLAGCGQVQHASTAIKAEPPQVKPAAEPAAPGRCHTAQLAGSLSRVEPGAGQRYASLVLTNTSPTSCTLFGYGGLQLVDGAGNKLPTDVTRKPNPAPTPVEVAPGQSASAALHWTAVPHEGEPTTGPCQPTAASVQVIPPDETDALQVPWTGGPVCGQGSIQQGAYAR